MPLSDYLEALNNPEGYIYRQVKGAEDDEKRELLQNLYGAGYLGREPSGVQQGRGVFGSMLQGIGLVGEPDPRPLTAFERFTVEQGKNYKSNQDKLTEKGRLELYQDNLNLVQDAVASGHLPGELGELMKGLPAEMQPGFARQAAEHKQKVAYETQDQALDIRGKEADIRYKNALVDVYGRAKAEEKHLAIVAKISNLDNVKLYRKMYDAKMKEVFAETDPDRRTVLLADAQKLHQALYTAVSTAPGGQDASVQLEIAGADPGTLMMMVFGEPRDKATDTRAVANPAGTDAALDAAGYPSSFTMPPNPLSAQPTPTGPNKSMMPTPTPGRGSLYGG